MSLSFSSEAIHINLLLTCYENLTLKGVFETNLAIYEEQLIDLAKYKIKFDRTKTLSFVNHSSYKFQLSFQITKVIWLHLHIIRKCYLLDINVCAFSILKCYISTLILVSGAFQTKTNPIYIFLVQFVLKRYSNHV